ncbi:MAG: hypothetical protein COA43_11155 [Robiginitomaculum sp.]|nr:MAG: hypothetical protein COA43_11155 [Robiginitomaculum sp.]
MPKFRFDKVYHYRPTEKRQVTIIYNPSVKAQAVNEECAKLAEAAGVGEIVEPRKTKKNDESSNT